MIDALIIGMLVLWLAVSYALGRQLALHGPRGLKGIRARKRLSIVIVVPFTVLLFFLFYHRKFFDL